MEAILGEKKNRGHDVKFRPSFYNAGWLFRQ